MTPGGTRMPTWKERENNKRRERRRRAIAAKIYAGLRAHGGYNLPKHCDNNEVLRALCDEAGWTVEPDGTTYRKGCKPVARIELVGASAPSSSRSSYQPSPSTSYNPSPASSSFPSPTSSSYITNANNPIINGVPDANSLIPWLKNLSSASSSSASSSRTLYRRHNFYMHTGSISAPVTPPMSSPTACSPRIKPEQPSWPPGVDHSYLPSSSPSSPTVSLVSSRPLGSYKGGIGIASEGSSRMWTPGQSGMCSPVMSGGPQRSDVHMMDCASGEFAFGNGSNGKMPVGGLVKAWEGERIHEECRPDELELTLGRRAGS